MSTAPRRRSGIGVGWISTGMTLTTEPSDASTPGSNTRVPSAGHTFGNTNVRAITDACARLCRRLDQTPALVYVSGATSRLSELAKETGDSLRPRRAPSNADGKPSAERSWPGSRAVYPSVRARSVVSRSLSERTPGGSTALTPAVLMLTRSGRQQSARRLAMLGLSNDVSRLANTRGGHAIRRSVTGLSTTRPSRSRWRGCSTNFDSNSELGGRHRWPMTTEGACSPSTSSA